MPIPAVSDDQEIRRCGEAVREGELVPIVGKRARRG